MISERILLLLLLAIYPLLYGEKGGVGGGSLKISRARRIPWSASNIASTAARHGYQATIDICEGKKEKKRNSRSKRKRKRRGKFLKRCRRRGKEDGE